MSSLSSKIVDVMIEFLTDEDDEDLAVNGLSSPDVRLRLEAEIQHVLERALT